MPPIIRSDIRTKCGVNMARQAATFCLATAPFGSSARSSTQIPGSLFRREMEETQFMATTNATVVRNRNFLSVLALSMVAIISCWYFFPSSTPQLGADERVYKTVDSLFTAVTAHDEKLIAQ